MLKEYDLRWLFALWLSFMLDNLIVLCQLNFVCLNHLCDLWLLRLLKT